MTLSLPSSNSSYSFDIVYKHVSKSVFFYYLYIQNWSNVENQDVNAVNRKLLEI